MRPTRFFAKPGADRRLLVSAAVLHPLITIALGVLPYARVQRGLARLASLGARPRPVENLDTRAAQAVRTIASLWPGSHCLTDALVAQCLLARHGVDTTVCFGVARGSGDGRPFDAHAWLERGGIGIIGARVIAYEPLRAPDRCESSLSPR
jgi:hypothetical protein